MSTLRRRTLILLGPLALAFALEAGLEGLARRRRDRPYSHRPYYRWSLFTYSGRAVGDGRGLLKLRTHPAAGYANMPGQRTPYFTTDGNGFRGGPPRARPPAGGRVVLVGGSTAFGTGLDSDEQTLARRLEAELGDVEVINAAVIGHQSGQELAYFTFDLADLRPDLVLALDGFNDFAASQEPGFRAAPRGYTDFIGDSAADAVEAVRRPLSARLAALPRFLFPLLLERAGEAASSFRPSPVRRRDAEDAAGSYAAHVSKLALVARAARGARLLCVIQPFQPGAAPEVAAEYGRFARSAAARLRRGGVGVIDLSGGGGIPARLYMDAVHLDARGNAELARALAGPVRRALGRRPARL